MIKKEGNSFVLRSKKTGKKLGVHASKIEAIKQEMAIKYSQARAAGKKKP